MLALSRVQRCFDDRGGAAVEYVLLITFVAAVVLSSLTTFGTTIQRTFLDSCTQIAMAIQPGSSC